MRTRSRVAYENRAVLAMTLASTPVYLARMRPLVGWLRFWFAHTAAAWTALRKRAARLGSTLARAIYAVSRQTSEQVASKGVAKRFAPRCIASVA